MTAVRLTHYFLPSICTSSIFLFSILLQSNSIMNPVLTDILFFLFFIIGWLFRQINIIFNIIFVFALLMLVHWMLLTLKFPYYINYCVILSPVQMQMQRCTAFLLYAKWLGRWLMLAMPITFAFVIVKTFAIELSLFIENWLSFLALLGVKWMLLKFL